jgi:hypothetical protein
MNRRLLHYTNDPDLMTVESRSQDTAVARASVPFTKPAGIWFSAEGKDDWPHWCRAEKFRTDKLSNVYKISLAAGTQLLRLEGAAELDAFTDGFGRPGRYGWFINWPSVAEAYQGIIIAPYLWSRRLNPRTSWYYGWDCASGCIWDASAISGLQKIRPRRKRPDVTGRVAIPPIEH